MEETRIKRGNYVRHFKRETLTELELRSNPRKYLYKVLSIDAINTVDESLCVVYGSMYDDKVYVRPYDEFMSEVDKVKYPDIKQKYRFETISDYQYKTYSKYC